MQHTIVTRTAESISDADLAESYARRVRPLVERYGAGSPRVAAVQARWGRMFEQRRAARDLPRDITALADAIATPVAVS